MNKIKRSTCRKKKAERIIYKTKKTVHCTNISTVTYFKELMRYLMSVRNNLRAVHARTRLHCTSTVLFDPCDDLQCACILIVSLHHYRAYQITLLFPLPLPTSCHKNPQPLYCSNVDYEPEFYS